MDVSSSSVGVPSFLMISIIWPYGLEPANIGYPRSSSAMTHPADQMSID